MKFRKLIAAAAALCITAPAATEAVNAWATQPIDKVVPGDVNVDYTFNLADMVLFQRYLRGDSVEELFPGYKEPGPGADVNEDGGYDIFDLVAMRKLIVKDINSAPEPDVETAARNLCSGIKKSPYTSGIYMEDYRNNKEFIDSQTKFTVEIFQKTYSENKGKNDLVSPYSIVQALGMTANGANGKTREEMENVLGGGMDIESLNRYLRGQRESTDNKSEKPKWSFSTANSIWARNDTSRIQPRPEFIQNCVDYYDSEFYIAPFDDTTLTDVNNWVDTKTNNMIPKILDKIDYNDVMYLVNAVAFEAQWLEPYEKYMIKEGSFTAADGTKQNAEMLCSPEIYISDENTEGMVKYYTGQRYGFAALLPNEETDIDTYIEGMTAEKLHKLISEYRSTHYDKATVKLPKFKYEYENELSEELCAMGMPTAFSGAADFSNMSAIADINPINIGYVIHKTFIDLDENGTKAAAATLVAMQDKAMPMAPEKEVVFDRPFVYCIFDVDTSLPVFIGVLNSLE
ncbi:MAG: hypothetical protein J6X85_06415 [Ruminococcus sp.]|nr:hypothetical protein [Ruminococcus sp.]